MENSNKKVGILTSTPSFINNYGAILQAYALQTQLMKLHMEPYIMKYADEHEYVQGKASIWQRLRGTIFNPNVSFRAKYRTVLQKVKHQSVYPLFSQFQKEHIRFYNNEYMNYQALGKAAKDFFAFITGSDQVWNPRVHHGINDPGYFLQFVPEGVKRISYAPSMGVNAIPESCVETLNRYIRSFDSVSIREESGRQIIKEKCGLDVPVMLDPTLLLDSEDYNAISDCSINPDKPYIVCYLFGKIPQVQKTIASIAKTYGYTIVNIPAGLDTKFKTDFRIGPRQFIGLISKAALVCTDSFHATVFAILYKKTFMAFCREDETKTSINMNSRITDLLKTLKLEDGWCGIGTDIDVHHLPEENYELSEIILQNKRKECIEYLEKALENK